MQESLQTWGFKILQSWLILHRKANALRQELQQDTPVAEHVRFAGQSHFSLAKYQRSGGVYSSCSGVWQQYLVLRDSMHYLELLSATTLRWSHFSPRVPPRALLTIANPCCTSDTKDHCSEMATLVCFWGLQQNLMIDPDLNHDCQTNAQLGKHRYIHCSASSLLIETIKIVTMLPTL